MAERLMINNQGAAHIQAYVDYVNLVGDEDGGQIMNEQEYENFKKKMIEKSKTRIFCSWQNQRGIECKIIGPATKCFCNHQFKSHEYLDPKNKKLHCKLPKCSCPCFMYIPAYGSYDFKCLCKHSHQLHDPITKKCSKGQCGCNKFASTWSCSCGSKYGEHTMVFETRDERIAQGKPVSDMTRLNGDLNAPMNNGGLMSFQALADGADKYENYIQALGDGDQQRALPGSNNQKSLGYKEMKSVKPPIEPNQKQQKLSNLNKKLNEEKKKDDYMHGNEDAYNQMMQDIQNEEEDTLSTEVKKRDSLKGLKQKQIPQQKSQQKYQQQQQQQQQQQPSIQKFQQESQENELALSEKSALTLFYTPHQYTRVQVNMKKLY